MYKNNIIKRIFTLVLAVLLLLPTYAGAFDNKEALELQALDIIDNVPFEELRLDKTITRAEFAKVVARLLGFDDAQNIGFDAYYTDVPDSHWAAGYINLAASLGIFEGSGDNKFYPGKSILLQDAVKTIVTVLGYKMPAQKTPYPQGYIAQATSLGLLKGITAKFDDAALRSDVFKLVYNALDVDRMTVILTTGNNEAYEVNDGDTIRNFLMNKGDVFKGKGVITSTFESYVIQPNSSIENDEIEIEGTMYKIGNSNANYYLGVKVDFVAYEDEQTGKYILEYVLPSLDVDILNIDSEEFEGYSRNSVTYRNENNKSNRTAQISESASILYNNRPSTDWEQLDIKNGDIRLIDNNGDKIYDVVLISDYVSFPVKSVDANAKLIKLKESVLYKGVNAIFFDMYDDDVRNVAYDSDGNPIDLEDITEGTLISVFEDGNGEYIKIVTGNDKVTGVITEMFDDGCTVDGTSYIYEVKASLSEDKISLGDEVTLYLNYEGNIGYIEHTDNTTERYGYIIGADTRGLTDTTVYISTAGKMEKRIDNLDNDPESKNTVTVLVSKNSSVEELKLAKRYTIKDQYGNSVRATDVSQLPQRQVVKFSTNSNGELSKIIYPEMLDAAYDMTYNARDNVFGKGTGTPFGIDDDTVVICVPKSEVSSLDDYLAEVEMKNSQQYKVCGYDFNAATSNVDLLMIEEEMDYESSGGIGVNTSIAVVQKLSNIRNADGEYVTQLVLLTKELGVELSKMIAVATSANESKISNLKVGDVIYYSQNSRRELVDYELVMSLKGDNSYKNTGEGTDNEIIYGRADSMIPNQIDELMNRRAYSVVVQTDEYNPSKVRTVYPHTTNSPPVFIYDREAKDVYFGTLDSILTTEVAGSRSDDIFIHLKNNTVQGIVLVRDSGTRGNN